MKKVILSSLFLLAFHVLFSQPTDAVIKKDLTTSSTIEIKFTKSTGTRQWNSGTGNWEYVRGVNIRKKTNEYPGLVVKIVGDAVYQYTGAGKYSYWKFRTISNEWEGIPNPTEEEIMKTLSSDWAKFYGFYFKKIVNLKSGPELNKEKRFNWGTPNKVTFYMNVSADIISSNVHLDDAEQVYQVNFFRDDIKSPWKNFQSFCSSDATKVLKHEDIGADKIRQLQQKTLAYTLAEEMAKKELASLPQLEIPEFQSAKEMADFFHNILRNGTPEQLKVALLKTLAPHLMMEGSNIQFNARGQQVYDLAVKAAYGGDFKYKDQYCQNYSTGNLTSTSHIYIVSAIPKNTTMLSTMMANDGYVNGVQIKKIKVTDLKVAVRQDQDARNFINSFTDKSKFCPDN